MTSDKVKLPLITKRQLSTCSSNSSSPRIEGMKNFHKLGGKVKNLLKIKRAFGADDREDVITTVKLLPSEPRFSSSLSPAAQFAMMKGYEDAVYEQICKQFPASKLFLRRNKTPTRGSVDLNDNENSSNMSKVSEGKDNNETEITEGFQHADDSLCRLEKSVSSEKIDILRSSKMTTKDEKLSKSSNSLTRPHSFPVVGGKLAVPRERKIILSQRLQSAMDILDTVRGSGDLNTISPRIKKYPRKIQPVSDFNQWSSLWSNEFKIVK